MKQILVLLAATTWGGVAWGQDAVQTLVGLPEYGVTSPEALTIPRS
jgi:hypothetical protein